MRRTVVSLFNTPAGRYAWYEDFPARLTAALAESQIEHLVGYKAYTPQARTPTGARIVVHDVHDAPHPARLRRALRSHLAGRGPVVLHTHSYSFRISRFRAVTRGHHGVVWWATMHRTPVEGARWKRWMRTVVQRAGGSYPERIYGCSRASSRALRTLFPARMVGTLVNGRLYPEDLTRYDPRESPRTAILVGRLVQGKGLDTALDAVRLILPVMPEFRLVVVGEGAELDRLRPRVAGSALGSAIRFAGYQADPGPWYAQADLIWIPTDPSVLREGLPLTALEAQGHALPAIYSMSGGLPEAQVPFETGVPIDPVTPETLAGATLDLLADPLRYERMRRAIVQHRARWSVDRMVEDYVREYTAHFDGQRSA